MRARGAALAGSAVLLCLGFLLTILFVGFWPGAVGAEPTSTQPWAVGSAATSPPTTSAPAPATTTTSVPAATPPAADISDAAAPTISLDPIGNGWPSLSRVIDRGPGGRRWVALTLDDDYNPDLTLSVLRTLRLTATPATLFLTGNANLASQEIVDTIARDPLLEVADHAGHHVDLTERDTAFLKENIGGGVESYRQMTGAHTSFFFRPPGGHFNPLVLAIAAQKGFLDTVTWDSSPGDYLGPSAAAIVANIMSTIRPGRIVLLHFNAPNTANALPQLIRSIKARGYKLVTLSQLLKGSRAFYDVRPDDPAYDAVSYMSRTGLLRGFPTGDYGAMEGLSRQDLARALVLGLGLHTTEVDTSHPTFADVLPPTSDTADGSGSQMARFDYIEEAVAHGLMQGGKGSDGQALFWPKATVRRIDLALAVAKAAGLPTSPPTMPGATTTTSTITLRFTDVPAQAQQAVAAVVAAGFMSADGDSFRPYDPESRAHAARVLLRLFSALGLAQK